MDLAYTPLFFRLSDLDDENKFNNIIKSDCVTVYDEIYGQLRELLKGRYPKRAIKEDEYEILVNEHIGNVSLYKYGVWVYYPWSRRMVHIIDREEFIELRTSRNKYKITDEEEEMLATKKIGVVGLSVGQSVAVTLAIERNFGELRIADFDILELTNLNRIRSGIHNIGLPKVIMVAREIAEIDPFLKVVPFIDGITKDNIDQFFTEGGQLDLVLDECDGLDIKIHLRHKAKALQIPVVMEASDKGTVDVERFDLEPDRPLLHGFIDHLDASKIGSLTNEEKIPFILPMLGADTISARLKASMVEIGQTITTWPQLASAVALGGAICTDVCRRILLGQYHESGRYFVDIEALIGDKGKGIEGTYRIQPFEYPDLTSAAMKEMIDRLPAEKDTEQITADIIEDIISAGLMAPSAGNNQPWKWASRNNVLYLFHNKKQSVSWSDQDDFISNISLGAALENVVCKAAASGYAAGIHLFPSGTGSVLVARVVLTRQAEMPAAGRELAQYIGVRCTNRRQGIQSPVEDSVLQQLQAAAADFPGAAVSFLTDEDQIRQAGELIAAAERVRFMHPQAHHEFYTRELVWNDSGKEEIEEGLDVKTLELLLSEEVGFKVASDPAVIALLNEWGTDTGRAFEKGSKKTIKASSAIGLITMPAYLPEYFIGGGMLLERIWLYCSKYGLAVQPVSAPVFLHTKIKQSHDHGMTDHAVQEITGIYKELSTLFPDLADKQGVFLFRLFKADPPSARSLRIPVHNNYHAF